MTREEAIKMLKYNSNVIHQTINGETDHKEVEALEMAIKALEQEPILDKIRAEIEKLEYLNIDDGSDGYDKYIEQYEVLKIIDKYKAESEDKG